MFSARKIMSDRVTAILVALAVGLGACVTQAAPGAVSFGGSTLHQLRGGSTGADRFAEYGRRDDKVSETLTVRSISDRTPFKTQVQTLVASIRKTNPIGKVSVLPRQGSDDVMISYLGDRGGLHVSLVVWRLAALDERVVAAIYQMDFDIDNKDAKDRVNALAAERALVTFAPADIAKLVADDK